MLSALHITALSSSLPALRTRNRVVREELVRRRNGKRNVAKPQRSIIQMRGQIGH